MPYIITFVSISICTPIDIHVCIPIVSIGATYAIYNHIAAGRTSRTSEPEKMPVGRSLFTDGIGTHDPNPKHLAKCCL